MCRLNDSAISSWNSVKWCVSTLSRKAAIVTCVASDYMEHLLYAVVVLLADIYLLAEPCRDIGSAYEYGVIIQFFRLAIPALAFRFLFGVRGRWRNGFCIASFGGGEVAFRPCFSLPAECLYRPVETS